MAVGLHFPLFQLLDSYVIIIIIIIIISHKLTFQGSTDGNILPLHFGKQGGVKQQKLKLMV